MYLVVYVAPVGTVVAHELVFMEEKTGAKFVRAEFYAALMFRGDHAYLPTSVS